MVKVVFVLTNTRQRHLVHEHLAPLQAGRHFQSDMSTSVGAVVSALSVELPQSVRNDAL